MSLVDQYYWEKDFGWSDGKDGQDNLFHSQWQELQGELATERERSRQLQVDRENTYKENCKLRQTNEQFAEALEDCASQIEKLESELHFLEIYDTALCVGLMDYIDFLEELIEDGE